jgi:hypothetical protein
MKARSKFLVGSGIIVITLVSLAYVGFTQSKTYYHTITELSTLNGVSLHQRMRVSGNVKNGTISHVPGAVDFVLTEQGKDLRVSYVGRDPLPSTKLCPTRRPERHSRGRRRKARTRHGLRDLECWRNREVFGGGIHWTSWDHFHCYWRSLLPCTQSAPA